MATKITLHNHAWIDTEERPIIPNLEFKNLLNNLTKENYEDALKKFSLTKFQNDLCKIKLHERITR